MSRLLGCVAAACVAVAVAFSSSTSPARPALRVQLPAGTLAGDTVAVVDPASGRSLTVKVPGHGWRAGEPLTVNRGLVVPEASEECAKSLQVHLHQTATLHDKFVTSIAVSWAVPCENQSCASDSNCQPEVHWAPALDVQSVANAGTFSKGVARTYPNATVGGFGSPSVEAAFYHVVLEPLTPGAMYSYAVRCGASVKRATFRAPRSVADLVDKQGQQGQQGQQQQQPYSFGVFGDMGQLQASHDTVDSLSSNSDALDSIFHVGDLSYAIGDEGVWNSFMCMIEPVASVVPWNIIPGNHDIRQGDSGIECGLPMLSRFETPRSRAAFPSLSRYPNSSERCAHSFNQTEGNPYWYAVNAGFARVVTYSTDSNLEIGSEQWNWLEAELALADTPEERSVRPWLLLMGHKPMYTASTFGGEISTRGNPSAGEGTEGELTAQLEALFVKYHVDVSFYGHIHSYNRMFPVKDDGATVELTAETKAHVYRSPSAPVHMMVGMSGAGHLGALYDQPAWSAYAEISYGWLKGTFENRTALRLDFIANGDGAAGVDEVGTLGHPFDSAGSPSVHDTVLITKNRGMN